MNWIDGLIIGFVVIIVGLIIYFGLIKNRKKGGCRNCPEASGVKTHRLLKDYKRRYRRHMNKKE
jgi:hypothetical protein